MESTVETIQVASGKSSLGWVLIGQSSKGLCAILMGEDRLALRLSLQERFPKAELIDAELEALVAKVVQLVESPGSKLDLPLDLRGTEFQRNVWQALRKIPAGSTVSYAELAERLSLPKATRAVAGACAANHLAVVIPCHRVVRTDGSLSGYRWGVERKRNLLERER